MTAHPAVDGAEIGRFAEALFAHASEGGFVSVRAFYDDDLARTSNEGPFKIKSYRLNGGGLAPVIASIAKLAEEAAEAGRPVVVCPPIATFIGGKASEKNLFEGLALSVELDQGAAAALSTLRAVIGQPTLVVESGGIWTDTATGEIQPKLHVHYRLSEPTQSADEHRNLKRARTLACELVGADATSKPAVHPMRWAGTLHRKDPANPKQARIVEYNPDSEIDLDDALGELEGLEILRSEADDSGSTTRQADPTGDDDLLHACANRIANTDLEWAAWNRLGMAFWRASEGSEAGFQAFDTVSRKSTKYDADGTRSRWAHYCTSPPDRIGAPTLVHEARKADPGFRRRKAQAETKPGEQTAFGDTLFDTSHDGLALGMGQKWDDARHVALFGRWLFYGGTRWERDERLLHLTRTREFLRQKADELVRWAEREVAASENNGKLVETCEAMAKSLRSAQSVANVIGLARSNPEQVATVDQWDKDPWLLGTPAGTIDLRTGMQRPARMLDYITKQTATAPAAPGTPAPLWQAFLERIFRHDLELVPYMQRVAGYALTGLTTEHALVFAWGEGGNGKGVFFNTLAAILADYAAVAAPDLLLVTNGDRHPTDMAMLMGARLVIASEVAPGKAWDEPKLKSLTGGDPITARFMRQDFFTYNPQFTLLVAGNHKPAFKSVDEAVRRRVQLVPFLQNIPAAERDPQLSAKLKAEAPAILRWAIEGCVEWRRQGLNPPQSVREASASYLDGEDVLGQWLGERCELGGRDLTAFDALFSDWRSWGEANGGPPWGGKTFSKALDERGFRKDKSNGIRGFRGIKLLPKATAQAFEEASRTDWESWA